ncbi:hypothetical protein KK083_28105 [Fulvivirgaceae bacterium PWU4]|uniref:Uncharacterized protein n=1 Tax=Chryseosolibacter histidini TaxID=2782349 RepID=A0AAP2DT90_9BACT|nr:hypothetical protein [Chryseosolibacter histidini]MBT1700787.1 hypothetical protein [Chryseosolibacter histidini]
MGAVNISQNDSANFKDLDEGNSIQVRVTIAEDQKKDYEKGKTVKVKHMNKEVSGKIVSEPILIDDKKEKGKVVLSLIIEKV